MKPPTFEPQPLDDQGHFVRDSASGLVYHRVFHRVLYADTDRSGVVYHANYLRYFELGRASLMRQVGFPYAAVEDSGYVYPIVDLGLTYHAPMHYDTPMWVHTRPGEIDRIRVRFDYLITHAEQGCLVARGHTRHCALNHKGIPVAVDPLTVRMWQSFPK